MLYNVPRKMQAHTHCRDINSQQNLLEKGKSERQQLLRSKCLQLTVQLENLSRSISELFALSSVCINFPLFCSKLRQQWSCPKEKPLASVKLWPRYKVYSEGSFQSHQFLVSSKSSISRKNIQKVDRSCLLLASVNSETQGLVK